MPYEPPGACLAPSARRVQSRCVRCLGIDPGLATIGIGLIEAENRFSMRALDWLVIKTKSGLSLDVRLLELQKDLSAFLAEAQPDRAVVERLFFAVNEKSALEVAHARGVILATLCAAGIPLIEPTPLQIKLAITGDGAADKRQMQDMVQRLLGLPELPTPVDAADALGMAMYGVLCGD